MRAPGSGRRVGELGDADRRSRVEESRGELERVLLAECEETAAESQDREDRREKSRLRLRRYGRDVPNAGMALFAKQN